jgi:2-keto-3-deoxy-L-rhamnonate aldolase RhmA
VEPNRVKQLYRAGKPAFGMNVGLPSPEIVEMAGLSGLDFVRIDNYHTRWNPESLSNMVRACYDQGITPWIRSRLDPWIIMTALDTGAQAISISNIGTVERARQAVAATRFPPKGEREAARPHRFEDVPAAEYLEWVANEVLLSVQVEGFEGIENYREIVKVEGIDCIQTGRSDIALAMDVGGDQYHPKVLDMEQRIIDAALEAGKQVSLLYPASEEGYEYITRRLQQGVKIITVDRELRVLRRVYGEWVKRLRAAE